MRRLLLIVAVALGAVLVLAAGPARAPAAEPRVTLDQMQSQFPDGMRFRLQATLERPVKDVILRYYLAGSNIGVRTRPSFEAGTTRLDIDWQLPTGRARYLPPLSDVRYEYEITDDQGTVYTTPRQTALYDDPRFSWKRLEVDGLEIWYHDLPEDQARRGVTRARELIRRMEALYGVKLAAPVRGVVYNGREIQSAISYRSDTTTAEGHFGGEAYTDLRLFTIAGVGAEGIAHETAHVLLDDVAGRGKGLVPSWLNEGLSQVAEGRPPQQRFTRALRLFAMGSVPARAADVGLHYAQGHSVAQFLLDRHGDAGMAGFVKDIARGTPIDAAATAAFGMDLTGVENGWRTSVGLERVDPPQPRATAQPQPRAVVPDQPDAPPQTPDAPQPEQPSPAGDSTGLPFTGAAAVSVALLTTLVLAGAIGAVAVSRRR